MEVLHSADNLSYSPKAFLLGLGSGRAGWDGMGWNVWYVG